jgi:hypothetical protein
MQEHITQHFLTENVMILMAIVFFLAKIVALLLYLIYILLEVRIISNVFARRGVNARRAQERRILEEMVVRRRSGRRAEAFEGLRTFQK